MASTPLPTQGIQFFWSTTTAVATAAGNMVGFVTDISGPSAAKNEIEVTSMNSSAKEFLMALPDFGEIQLSVNYAGTTEASHGKLWDDFISASTNSRKFVMKMTDSTTAPTAIMGQAYCKGYSFSASKEDAIKATITLRCTGPATISTTIG